MTLNSLPVWVLRAAFQLAKEWHPDRGLPADIAEQDTVQSWLDELRRLRGALRAMNVGEDLEFQRVAGGLQIRVPPEVSGGSGVDAVLREPARLDAFGVWIVDQLGEREAFLRTGFDADELKTAFRLLAAQA